MRKKEWEREGTKPQMLPEDEKILAEGKCDYLGFSYYMTNAVKADAKKRYDRISGRKFSVFCTKPVCEGK